jgi:formylglycine-generating enzyme required for sulfatase activity
LAYKRWFGTAPVGKTPDGNSFFGVFDMAGNVAEWTSSPSSKDYASPRDSKELAVRGGSWDLEDSEMFRATARDAREPSYRGSDVGFRCAR